MQTAFIIIIILLITMISMFIKTIVSMIIILIVTALCTTILIANLINSWFAFILFLIYITGLLVLFRYILAMTPNNFRINFNSSKMFFSVFFIFYTSTITEIYLLPESNQNFEWEILKLYNEGNIPMYWFIVLLLLVALLIVVNLVYKSPLPLRPFVK